MEGAVTLVRAMSSGTGSTSTIVVAVEREALGRREEALLELAAPRSARGSSSSSLRRAHGRDGLGPSPTVVVQICPVLALRKEAEELAGRTSTPRRVIGRVHRGQQPRRALSA